MLKYRVSEVTGWFIISPAGRAENNEPLRVRHLFHRWLAREGVKVIVDLKEINQFGVWEVGLFTSFKIKEKWISARESCGFAAWIPT